MYSGIARSSLCIARHRVKRMLSNRCAVIRPTAAKSGYWPTSAATRHVHSIAVTDMSFYRATLRRARWCHSKSSVRLCLAVCPSVTFRYRAHIGWNSSKIISRPNNLRLICGLTQTWAIWSNANTPKLGWNMGGVRSTKTCHIYETVQDMTKVTMTG